MSVRITPTRAIKYDLVEPAEPPYYYHCGSDLVRANVDDIIRVSALGTFLRVYPQGSGRTNGLGFDFLVMPDGELRRSIF